MSLYTWLMSTTQPVIYSSKTVNAYKTGNDAYDSLYSNTPISSSSVSAEQVQKIVEEYITTTENNKIKEILTSLLREDEMENSEEITNQIISALQQNADQLTTETIQFLLNEIREAEENE